MTQRVRGRRWRQAILQIRFHEDAVEIAACLFNKELLSQPTIDDAADEIESFLRALYEEENLRRAANQRPAKAELHIRLADHMSHP